MSKLVVGATYLTRSGERVTLVRKEGEHFLGEIDSTIVCYTQTGTVTNTNHPHGLDLMDLVANPDPVRTVSPAPEPVRPDLPYEELIQAVLDGKTVQYQTVGATEWVDMRNRVYALRRLLSATDGDRFRLKPEIEHVWLALWDSGAIQFFPSKVDLPRGAHIKWWARIAREIDSKRIVDVQHEEPK